MEQTKKYIEMHMSFGFRALPPILSGTLLGIGFLVPALSWLSFFGLALFLTTTRGSSSVRHSFFHGWLLGFVVNCFALYGIFLHTLPIDWFGVSSFGLQILLVGGSWLLASAVLALGTGVFSVALRFVRGSLAEFLTIPVLWMLCEMLSALIFSIIGAGPGSLIGTHFTLGHLGYLLANDIVLLQAAWLGGVYVLSFIIVAVNVLIYRMFVARAERGWIYGVSALLLSVYIVGHVVFNPVVPRSEEGQGSVLISAVSTYVPVQLRATAEEEQSNAENLRSLMNGVAKDTQMIVLPEGADFFRHTTDRTFLATLPLVVDSEDVLQPDGFRRARAVFRSPDTLPTESEKQLRLPLGEYMPYIYRALLLLASEEFRAQVLGTRIDVQGDKTELASISDVPVAVRFCNEVMSPYFYASDTHEGAQVLVSLSSHAWYHGSRLVFRQMQNVAKVRAVENGRWYIQSSNMVPAFVLDPYGRVVAETQWGIPQVLSVQVSLREGSTPYVFLTSWHF